MEVILTLGVVGLIFLFFKKLLSFIASAILIFVIGSLVALFTEATLITSILVVCSIVILSKLTYKSFFKFFRKMLRRSRRYKEGLLEKMVDILFSLNIMLMSIMIIVGIIYISVIHNFDSYYLLETIIYGAVIIKIVSVFEKKVVGK